MRLCRDKVTTYPHLPLVKELIKEKIMDVVSSAHHSLSLKHVSLPYMGVVASGVCILCPIRLGGCDVIRVRWRRDPCMHAVVRIHVCTLCVDIT